MVLSKNKHKRLTPRHRKFGEILPKSENATEAYMALYPRTTRESARASACRLLKEKPEIMEYAREVANRNGLTIDKATKTLAKQLTSQKVIISANGDKFEVDDNTSQIKASELALKVHGALKDNDNSVNINVQHNQMMILDKLGSRLDAVLRMFEPLKAEALADESVYRKASDGVPTCPQVMNRLSTGSDVVSDAEFTSDDSTVDAPVNPDVSTDVSTWKLHNVDTPNKTITKCDDASGEANVGDGVGV